MAFQKNYTPMKKFLLSLIGMLCATSFAQSDPEPMPVVADLGGAILNPDGTVFTVYPATVVLEGQWCDIALWKAPFSVSDYPTFRVRLQRGPEEDGYIQLFTRNRESAMNYKGPYIPFAKNQTTIEADFLDYDDNGTVWFDDDPICTWFALQKTNIGPERQEVTIMEAVIIDEDGNEIVSRNVRNGSWKPSPSWVEPDPLYEADVLFTQKGIVGLYNGEVEWGTVHKFTFRTREPLPEGFTLYVVIDDGDDTTYTYPVPSGVTEYTTPAIDDNYLRVYLEYAGSYPRTLHFNSITRQVVDPAGIRDVVTMKDVAHRDIYNAAGQRLTHEAEGLTIVRDLMDDGTTRVKKIIKQ